MMNKEQEIKRSLEQIEYLELELKSLDGVSNDEYESRCFTWCGEWCIDETDDTAMTGEELYETIMEEIDEEKEILSDLLR